MLYSYLKYTLDFGMKMPPRDSNLRGRGNHVRTSDGMNWNLQDLVYEALSEEWRKRDGEDDDPWENHGPDGYQPPSYEPVNPERRTAQTPSDGLI